MSRCLLEDGCTALAAALPGSLEQLCLSFAGQPLGERGVQPTLLAMCIRYFQKPLRGPPTHGVPKPPSNKKRNSPNPELNGVIRANRFA